MSSRRRETSIEGITFSGDTLSADAPVIDFSFNVVRTAQVAYQLVYRRQGIWDFDQSTLIYDNNGDFGSYAIAGRTLSPGLKERSITLNTADAQSSGYVLLQILVIEKGLPSVVCRRYSAFRQRRATRNCVCMCRTHSAPKAARN